MLSPSMTPDKIRERVRRSARKRLGIDISEEEVQALYLAQGGKCAICGETRSLHGTRGLYVDHDHATRQVRALVCHECNAALGLMGEEPERLRRAARYIEHFRAQYTEGRAAVGWAPP